MRRCHLHHSESAAKNKDHVNSVANFSWISSRGGSFFLISSSEAPFLMRSAAFSSSSSGRSAELTSSSGDPL